MTKPKYVIVVGIDYSAASERALEEAFTLGTNKHGVQLHVVNVRSAPSDAASTAEAKPLPPWRYWASELHEYVARKAAAFQATTPAAPYEHLYTHQRMNDPASELAKLATNVGADLVVLGTHEWPDESPSRPGSVAEIVTRLAPCPVLIVRRKAVLPEAQASEPHALPST
ncbi:MAG TPA: universal stress protein [Polyangiaceae bacterium]|nr:universal stress protein [Polyangiaceae bacterium]